MIADWRDAVREFTVALEKNEVELREVITKTLTQGERVVELGRTLLAENETLETLEKRTRELEARHHYLSAQINALKQRNEECEGYAFDEQGHLQPASLAEALQRLRPLRQDDAIARPSQTLAVPRFGQEVASDDLNAIRALQRHCFNGGDCRALWARADEIMIGHRTFTVPIDDRRERNLPRYDGGSAA